MNRSEYNCFLTECVPSEHLVLSPLATYWMPPIGAKVIGGPGQAPAIEKHGHVMSFDRRVYIRVRSASRHTPLATTPSSFSFSSTLTTKSLLCSGEPHSSSSSVFLYISLSASKSDLPPLNTPRP